MRSKFLLILITLGLFPGSVSAEDAKGTVVLVHGILNRPLMMKPIEKALEKEGFRVINWGYESTEKNIEVYAADLQKDLAARNIQGPLHFVGFSLGSMILRYYLSHSPPKAAGRFVQIAPPNHGSTLINKLYVFKGFQWIYGTSAIQQLEENSAFLKTCGTPKVPFGIIYGGLANGVGVNPALSGDNDGAVSVQSALLPGATDCVQIKTEHTLLLLNKETARQTVAFLNAGQFVSENKQAKK